ncbi:MAG: hypothetical protein M3Z33_07265 [Actinomycetota bacterium]|nr:hypothetical protein [Actinomycetota bacterium]
MKTSRRTALTAVLGLGLLAATVSVHELGSLRIHNRGYVALAGVMLAICGAVSALLWRRARRIDVLIVLVVAATARALLAFDAPTLSDDAYRFVWDGRVQVHGINPYAYAPADPRLKPLRDFQVFTRINRPFTRTVYPPTDEAIYAGVNAVIGDGVLQVKLALLAAEALAVALLLVMLARTGCSLGRVALYAWHPLAIAEIAGSGHPDPLLIAPLLGALLLWDRRRRAGAAVALGVAALAKFVPILLAPILVRRLRGRFAATLAATIALLYLPYLGAGSRVVGSIDEFAGRRFGSGPYNWLLDAGAPTSLARGLLVVALALVVSAAAVRPPRDLRSAAASAAVVLGATMLAAPDVEPWYPLWVLPLLCLGPAPWLLWLCASTPVYYLTFGPSKVMTGEIARLIVWAPALALAALEAIRWLSRRRSGAEAPARAPEPAQAQAQAQARPAP